MNLFKIFGMVAINNSNANKSLDETNNKASKVSKELQKKFETVGKVFTSVGDKIEKAGKKLSVFSVATGTALVASMKSAIDFEDAFTGVEKTVDGTTEQLSKLKQGIRDMAKTIPASTTEIAGVAEAAGQLGIKTDDILNFTKVMIDLGNATNLSADEAASSLAKFANIMNTSADDYSRLGATIVDLGNNFATTEADITSMAMRIAGAGKTVGLSEANVLSLATALSSVGIEAEMGGSAISKAMIQMSTAVEANSEQLKDFAKIAGMSTKEFKKSFENDAIGTITKFIVGLGDTESAGESTLAMLSDLGFEEVRLRDTMLRAANASDVFSNAINLGNNAWEENTALTNEANKRYGTLKSQIEITKNKVKDLAITFGDKLTPIIPKITDKIDKLTTYISNLNEQQMETILKVAGVIVATGPLVTIFGKATKGVGSLFDGISKLQGAGGLKGLISNFGIIPNILGKATNGFKGLLNPVNLVKGAFGGVGNIITKFATSIVGLIAQFDLSGGGLSGVLTVLKLLLGAVSSGFTSLLGAILPIAAPIIALIGVIVVLKDNWDKVVQVFQKFIQNTGLVEKFNEIKEKIQPLIEKFKGLKDLFTVVGTVVIGLLIPTIASLAGLFNGAVSAISPLLTALGGIIDILAGIGSFIVAVFTGDLDKAGESVKKIGQGILDVFGGLWGAIKGFLQGFVDGVIGFFKGLWDTLVGHSIVPDTINSIIDWFKQLLGKPLEFVSNLKDDVVNFFGNLKDGAIEKATGLINGAKEKFSNLKSSVVEKVSSLKDSAIDKFNSLKDGAVDKFNSMRDKAASIFSNMKDKITNPISSAKDKVNEYINDIKGFFNNFSAKIKMPHFNIKNASLNPADWIKNGVPKISVDWYAKAMDYGRILDEPTIFGINENGQFMGAGEVGSETVVGTNSLMNMIQQAVTNQNLELNARMDTLIEILLKYLPLLLKRELYLDTGAVVGELTPLIDKELGNLADKKGRGR